MFLVKFKFVTKGRLFSFRVLILEDKLTSLEALRAIRNENILNLSLISNVVNKLERQKYIAKFKNSPHLMFTIFSW